MPPRGGRPSYTRMFPALIFSAALSLALWLHGLGEPGVCVPFVTGLVAVAGLVAARMARGSAGACLDWRWLAPLAGVAALVALQAANPSHRFLAASRGLEPLAHLPFLPRSVDRAATLEALLLLAGYASVFWLARVLLADVRSRAVFVAVQAAGGVGMAALVIAQRQVPPDGALYAATGAFTSPNQYAAYVNLLLPAVLLGGAELQQRAGARGLRALTFALRIGAAAVLVSSVFLSGSRLGAAISVLLVGGVVAGEWAALVVRRRFAGQAVAAGLAILLLAGSLWALSAWTGAEELRRLPGDLGSRLTVWRAALAMSADRWVSGTGAGTFALAFPYYQPAGVAGFYRHAHNEFVQIVAEFGAVGAALLAFMTYGMMSGRTAGAAPAQALTGRERRAILLALGGLALHAMVDFPLRLPALVCLAAAWLGMSGGQLIRGGAVPAADVGGTGSATR